MMENLINLLGENAVMWLVGIFVVIWLFQAIIRILKEYERGVLYFLGRYQKTLGAGMRFVIPVVQQLRKVDIRTIVHDVPTQDVISRDNVSVKVNAVLYYRVVDANRAINKVEDYMAATSQLAQTTLRSVLGKHDLDEMLMERDKLNHDIQLILDAQTDAWGIKVANVEIKHVDLDQSMVRAIAKQAEAERERRAKVISAQGEQQAAQKLAEAGAILAREPNSMQLRYLGALQEIANNRTNTIVFPFAIEDLGKAIKGLTANDR